MSEKIPGSVNQYENGNLDGEVKQLVIDAMAFMKRAWDFELSNFEYMKLFHIAKEVIKNKESVVDYAESLTREEKFTGENWNDFRSYSFGSAEIVNRFFLNEYGIHPQEFPKEDFGGATEDFKRYLKVLQKKHREGDDEQSQLTHE